MRYSLQYNENEPSFIAGVAGLTSRLAKILYFMCDKFDCLVKNKTQKLRVRALPYDKKSYKN